ncbi:hypothetical protein ACFM35_09855 [Microbacterium sp. P01]|uniref:hypothetical protein n=1 Tax=unclassified Microbacterium TaxID=2609290 RepID=UPI00366FBCF0
MSGVIMQWMPYLSIALATFATIGAMLSIGVAFLLSPSRATLYWSYAYTLLMVGTFAGITSGISGIPLLLPLSFGAIAGVPALMWSGLRAVRGVRSLPWIAAVVAVGAGTLLVVTYEADGADVARRAVIFAAGAFAGLIVVEWWRVPRPRPGILLPLVVASAAFFLFGLANVAGGFTVQLANTDASVDEVRVTSMFVVLLYMACSLVTVLGLAIGRRSRQGRPAAGQWEAFERAAFTDLAEAQRLGESWSVVAIVLDDVADVRQTAGASAIGAIVRQFEAEIAAVLPLDSTIGTPEPGVVIAVVPRSDAVVRDLLRDVLTKVAGLDAGDRPLQLSASIGWAQTSTVGYELNALVYLARAAAALATDNGGDRWERTGGAAIQTLIGSLQAR